MSGEYATLRTICWNKPGSCPMGIRPCMAHFKLHFWSTMNSGLLHTNNLGRLGVKAHQELSDADGVSSWNVLWFESPDCVGSSRKLERDENQWLNKGLSTKQTSFCYSTYHPPHSVHHFILKMEAAGSPNSGAYLPNYTMSNPQKTVILTLILPRWIFNFNAWCMTKALFEEKR